jgi:signal peptidase I
LDNFLSKIVTGTEAVLTWRARRRWTRKQKQKQKNVILDWVEAFVWSACVVLLVNQYAFQAYEIPSPSMEPTLLGHDIGNDHKHDRIFVNKFEFGPELLPGLFKLPGFTVPHRGDIIIFENPAYNSPVYSAGPVAVTAFDITQRLIYMMTLSLVDIDQQKNPDTGKMEPKPHFLIKRGVGYSGDTVRWHNGDPQFQLPGTDEWLTEADMKKAQGLAYGEHRDNTDIRGQFYALIPAWARAQADQELQITPTAADLKARDAVNQMKIQYRVYDEKEEFYLIKKAKLAVLPQRIDFSSEYFQYQNGTWVPDGSLLPLGDNRDNSEDGRWFGPVPLNKILGQAAIRYWPLGRAGGF